MFSQPNYGIEAMTARDTLATNLRALMDSHHTYKTTTAIEQATKDNGLMVGKSTVDRVLKCQTTLNLDFIEAIAAIYGLDSWQLLSPGLTPKNPPVLRSIGEAEDKLYGRIAELAKQITELQK
jgi:hypothetical protein